MISSFRLPDLVLGVRIRADVTGARQAARDLKNAVGRELGTGGGTTGGGTGGGFGGGLLGGLLGAGMMGGGKLSSKAPRGIFGGGMGFKSKGKYERSISDMGMLLALGDGAFSKAEIGAVEKVLGGKGLSSTAGKTVTAFGAGKLAWRNKAKISGTKLAGVLNTLGVKEIAQPYLSALSTGLVAGAVGKSAAGPAAGLGRGSKFSPRMFSRIGRAAGLGGLGGLGATMMMVGRFLGPLGFALIGAALAFKMAMSFVVSSLSTATNWIRKMGITAGAFGNFTAQLDNFTVVWRNLKLEFGLMLIKVFDLGSLFQSMIPVIVLLSQLVKEVTETPKAQGFIKGFLLKVAPWATPEGWNALGEFIGATNPVGAPWGATGRSVPTTGPLAGISNSVNMSPAALQGSMEASRIINQSIMSDTTQTARNTKLCADTLQQILYRSPELLAIHG